MNEKTSLRFLERSNEKTKKHIVFFLFLITAMIFTDCADHCPIDELEKQPYNLMDQDVANLVIGFGQSNMCCAQQNDNGLDSVFLFEYENGFQNARPLKNIAIYLADEIAQNNHCRTFVVNVGQGGTWLCENDEALDWNVNSEDELFDILKVKIDAAMEEIHNLGYDKISLSGLWAQGESDSINDECSDPYGANEQCLFYNLRTHIGFEFPIVNMTIRKNSNGNGNGKGDSINEEKLSNSSNMNQVYLLETSGLETEEDGIHYTEEAKIKAAEMALELLMQ